MCQWPTHSGPELLMQVLPATGAGVTAAGDASAATGAGFTAAGDACRYEESGGSGVSSSTIALVTTARDRHQGGVTTTQGARQNAIQSQQHY